MKKLLVILSLLPLIAQGQVIATFAGNGTPGGAGDGGLATAAQLNAPGGLAFDGAGNTYITSYSDRKIRKVSPGGIISTFAGTGVSAYGGDGGPATAAQFVSPLKLVFDAAGNLYVSDLYGSRIRKINPAGIISTYAGTGLNLYNGDGIAATAANIHHPAGICIDHAGNFYVSDYSNARIRKITPSGIISTVAGTGVFGFSGDGGPATAAQVFQVFGMAVDAADNLYLADASNNRVRKITPAGVITTIAGTGVAGFSGDGGAATAAQLNNPADVFVDNTGNIFIADQFNNRIRKISPAGTITTIVGTGVAGFSGDGGLPTLAQINMTNEIELGPTGALFICDNGNNRVRYFTECNLPDAGSISGSTSVCQSATTTFSATMGGGVWSSASPGVATVSSSGIVTGVSAGTAIISYVATNSCGTAMVAQIVTVNPLPNAGSITGITTICTEMATTLSDAVPGGAWSSSASSVATVSTSGVVTGMTPGTSVISYTVSNSCGSAVATTVVTVSSTYTPVLTITASPGTTVTPGSTVTMTATTTGLISTPGYQWFVNGVVVAGATTSVYSSAALTNGDSVTCCVYGTGNCELDTCRWVKMTVIQPGIVREFADVNNIQLLPNPNNGTFIITGQNLFNQPENMSLEISDMIGQVVYSKKLSAVNGKIEENVSLDKHVANGMYLVRVYLGDGAMVFHMLLSQ